MTPAEFRALTLCFLAAHLLALVASAAWAALDEWRKKWRR
jgi:hypothetical protein